MTFASPEHIVPHPSNTLSRGSLMGLGRSHQITFIVSEGEKRLAELACLEVLETVNQLFSSVQYQFARFEGLAAFLARGSTSPGARETLFFLGNRNNGWTLAAGQRVKLAAAVARSRRAIFCGGAVFLAMQAGLTAGRRLAVHPNFRPAFNEDLRCQNVVSESFWIDGSIWSATAAGAMMRLVAFATQGTRPDRAGAAA